MGTKIIKVIIDWVDNYGAYSDDVPGVVATHKTFEGIKEAYASAVEFHLEGLEADEIPLALQGKYQFEFEQTAAALLHSVEGKTTLNEIHRKSGLNAKLLSQYKNGDKKPSRIQHTRIVNAVREIGKELQEVV